jgi:hypothetical protein
MTSKLGVKLPHKWAGNENWKDIEVDNGEVSYNAIGRPLYRECEFGKYVVPIRLIIPTLKTSFLERCGGEGHYLITRTSTLTGKTYTDYACEYHAKEWIAPHV